MRSQLSQILLRAVFLLLLGAGIAGNWTPALAASRNCTAPERAAANAQLNMTAAQQNAARASHLPWGAPGPLGLTATERTLFQPGYITRYDRHLLVPIWSAEKVVASTLGGDRINCFRPDPRIPAAEQSNDRDYDEAIYDQGHLTPSADQASSVLSGANSFLYTNMTPQTCEFNEGVWKILESITRLWANDHPSIYLINGSVFDRDNNGVRDADSAALPMVSQRGTSRVAVPSHFYKIVAFTTPTGIMILSILMPNDHTQLSGAAAITYLQGHITTVAAIEHVTGLHFFPNAHPPITEATSLWPIHGAPGSNSCSRLGITDPGPMRTHH